MITEFPTRGADRMIDNLTESDMERIAFELLERRAPHIAELLLWMAALPLSTAELTTHFRALTMSQEMREEDFGAVIQALRHARRIVATGTTSH